MYMSFFGCRCKQPLIKPDPAQMKQRWSRTKTTTYQQNIEDDKWGQHVEQGDGPTPQSVGRPTYIWWAPLAHTPTNISIFKTVGGAHMEAIGQSTNLSCGPTLSRFTPTNIPMMNMWWKFPTIDHMVVPRSVWSNGGEGAQGSLTWRWSSPYSIYPYKYSLRGPS